MPAIQRRGGRISRPGRILNTLEILNYAVAAYGPLVEDPAVYVANRQQLLAKGLHCTAFWMHEPGIPDELRPHADDDLDAEWLEADGSLPPSPRQVEARRAWLAAHPVEA